MEKDIAWRGGVLGLWLLAASAQAQVPKPPPRGNENDHKTSAWQDPLVERLARAWAVCLSPHLGSKTEDQIRASIEKHLQNQYSDWATYDFYRDVGDLLCEEFAMNGNVFPPDSMREERRSGGVLVPLVDQLLSRAVETSGGVLHFNDSRGGSRFQQQHDRVMHKDPAMLEALDGLIQKGKLDAEQRKGMKELTDRYSFCLKESLGVPLQDRFTERLGEAFGRVSTDEALLAVRSRLRCALRKQVRGVRRLTTVEEHIRLDQEVEEYIDSNVPATFWSKLRFHHENMLTAPKDYRNVFQKQKGCDL